MILVMVAEVPPHGWTLAPGQWWACLHPIRPVDELAVYEGRCELCLVAAELYVAKHGDVALPYWDAECQGEGVGRLSWLIETARGRNAGGSTS